MRKMFSTAIASLRPIHESSLRWTTGMGTDEGSLKMPTLPIETCEEILSYLQGDFKTLAACSLACRAWLPVTRSYVFGEVLLQRDEECEHFRVILDESPTVGLHVRILSVKDANDHAGNIAQQESSWVWLLLRLNNLEVLNVVESDLDLSGPIQDVINTRHPVLPIKRFRMARVAFRNNELQILLSSCPLLTHLAMHHSSPWNEIEFSDVAPLWRVAARKWFSNNAAIPITVPCRPIEPNERVPIQTLIWEPIRPLNWQVITNFRNGDQWNLRLRRLSVSCRDFDTTMTPGLRNLLEQSAETLEELHMNVFSGLRPGIPTPNHPFLIGATKLKAIYIRAPLLLSNPSCHSWDGLLDVLSDIRPSHSQLEKLSISMSPTKVILDWDQVGQHLTRIMHVLPQMVVTLLVVPERLSGPGHGDVSAFVDRLLDGLHRSATGGRLALMWFGSHEAFMEYGGLENVLPPWFRVQSSLSDNIWW
ncbi:uncharacterized protein LAESUDRAFT_811819 [Laetiporus sulphureus 93-53]|uniref:F-box domain-containing protein n=1 Tax=Laetiporus sulphureus 93-53 TaxID=1314785 RepID=A0A165EYV1_9APHY|nr:uncharacterized protein LAESUDRAFT_811819 [Laetiporus sulphureus 93-53]KZT08003.1 hypothetical protein LAESUDRAFT_811819 [Laetiporus sulphureus 93-53]